MDSIIQGQRESYKKVNRTMRRRDGVMRVRYAISKNLEFASNLNANLENLQQLKKHRTND